MFDSYEQSAKADSLLTLEAMDNIVAAQANGTLPHNLSITRHPTQIVLALHSHDPILDSVVDWVSKHYGGELSLRHRGFSTRPYGKRGRKKVDEYMHIAPLRPTVEEDGKWPGAVVPRIEVWGVKKPHHCERFVGHVDANGSPRWKCQDCGLALKVAEARDKGLVP